MNPSPIFSVAPMMDRTDRHFRYFMRQVTTKALLYTEMVVGRALQHGDKSRLLDFDPVERPLALQLGGDEPGLMGECAAWAEDWGYDEVNINVGCPSDRVQQGCFGAQLMARPDRVAECVAAMRARTSLPVTVKCRIGIDDRDRYEDLLAFVDRVSEAGPARFSVHARKAWLQGLSPHQNRTVPPLRHGDVHRLKRERPHLQVEINGGIVDLPQAEAQLEQVDAVMVGRAAYDDPFTFAEVDARLFGTPFAPVDRVAAVAAMIEYTARWTGRGGRAHSVLRHLMGVFSGQRGARAYRRVLSTEGSRPDAGPEVLELALQSVAGSGVPVSIAQA